MPTTPVTDGFKTPTSPFAEVAKAAEKELGGVLFAVSQTFGSEEVERAADLWLARLETTDGIDCDAAKGFRRITIQTAAQLSRIQERYVRSFAALFADPGTP